MRILIIGGGGREHALAWKLSQSARVTEIYVAPGNGGTATAAKCGNVAIAANDIPALASFANDEQIDLTIVGPEEPLVLGIVDTFQAAGLRIFGPTAAAAQIEGSKAWAKAVMQSATIPTAQASTFKEYRAALKQVIQAPAPPVVKVSGLAAGKGVYVPTCYHDAEAALYEIYVDKKFGDDVEVVIEEMLEGAELSVLAFCDGRDFALMPAAQDHKRLHDGDEGPNTGGMGAYAPAPLGTPDLLAELGERVFAPALAELMARGIPYRGVLYAGIMLTASGPKVLEFNCRLGDPETQVLLPLLASDLIEIIEACLDGQLANTKIRWHGAAATVVLAAAGYPDIGQKGHEITGLPEVATLENVIPFQAGTAVQGEQIVTNGGRVLSITGLGVDVPAALERAYAGVEVVNFEGAFYRRDIGKKVVPL